MKIYEKLEHKIQIYASEITTSDRLIRILTVNRVVNIDTIDYHYMRENTEMESYPLRVIIKAYRDMNADKLRKCERWLKIFKFLHI